MGRSVRGSGDVGEGSVLDRSITWLCERVLGDEELPGEPKDVEDPDVIKLMAHQHSFTI
jgi:hypothetical protein